MRNQICPWCGHKFQGEDSPLRSRINGNHYCNRDCYELDLKYPKQEKSHEKDQES